VHEVVCHGCGIWGYTSVMLAIAVEVAGAVCGMDCSMFSRATDCLHPLTACWSLAGQVGRSHIACCGWEMHLRFAGPLPWWTRCMQMMHMSVVLCDTHDTPILIVVTYATIPVSPRSRYTAVYRSSTKYLWNDTSIARIIASWLLIVPYSIYPPVLGLLCNLL